MKIHHFGNTANNAFHNALLMSEYTGWSSQLPIQMLGLNHGISAPAWEVCEFTTPNAEWVAKPDWKIFPEAAQINAKYSDLQVSEIKAVGSSNGDTSNSAFSIRNFLESTKTSIGRQIVHSPLHNSFNSFLVKRSIRKAPEYKIGAQDVSVLYGADSLLKMRPPRPLDRVVTLEHGTVRWIADGAREDAEWRLLYRKQVQKTRHLWVTNLDPRTLEIAEDVMPGRWTALPHPFMFSTEVPFQTNHNVRSELLESTKSEFLILLASSQNWSKHHDKGSKKALNSFIQLRRQGLPVGLVAAEWGLQLQESKDFLASSGLSQYVRWVSPMGRFELQRMMANVDVVWDQFGLDAFGALALRSLEQGAPLISRGLTSEGAALIGSQIPWMTAESEEEIVSHTNQLFVNMQNEGRSAVLQSIHDNSRSWLHKFHSPRITANLQNQLYSAFINNNSAISMPNDAWAKSIDTESE